MPLNASPKFVPPWDLHLLRGQGPVRLGRLLQVSWAKTQEENDLGLSTLDDYLQRYPDVEMEFRPVFNYSSTGNRHIGFGIELNRLTGELTANAWPVAEDAPANFIVEVTVVSNGAGLPAAQMSVARVRVHIHRHINYIWITPHTLSVRRSRPPPTVDQRTPYAFTVRASFDDGTVGDVTCSDQIEMLPASHFFRWNEGGQRIQIPDTVSAGSVVAVMARESAAWGGQQATGIIEVLEPWENETHVPGIEWIEGNPQVLDGTLPADDAPNVLFVNCGFTNPEANAFRQITDMIVEKLKTQQLQPYGYLSQSINYWRMVIPDQEFGVSVRCEVFTFVKSGQWYAAAVPSATPPPDSGTWEMAHLLYMAGLPIRADLALVGDRVTGQPLTSVDVLSERSASQLDFTRLVQKWNVTMRPTPARNVSEDTVRIWLQHAARTFIDEVNNFPGTSIGLPPSASKEETGLLGFHELRGGKADFTVFFLDHVGAAPRGNAPPPPVTLRVPPGRNLGNLWRSSFLYAFDNSNLIVGLSNVPYGRANALFSIQVRPYLDSPSQDGPMPGIPVAPVSGRDALTLAPLPAARGVRSDTWRVFGHELGHALGLGDEYVERAETFTGNDSGLDTYGNLCTTASFLNQNGEVRIPDIKWNWDRIRFASVIVQLFRIGESRRFEVHVNPQPVPWFLPNDIVLFRRRERQRVINRAPPTSIPYIVESISNNGAIIIVAPREATGDIGGITPGSIIYKPVPHANPSLRLRLVSPAAERIMQIAIKGTMTGVACSPAREHGRGGSTQVPVESDPLGRVSSKNLSGLVGAYFGGGLVACGIVHPTGQCMMRNSHSDTSTFCPVCRYVLVEQVNPERHHLIDRDYEKKYPR